MIPTFLVDAPLLLLIGVVFSYGVKGTPRGSVMATRAYLAGKLLVTLFVVLVFFSYRLAPDWMFMYFADTKAIPNWVLFYILVLYYFAYDAGFLLRFELNKLHPTLPPLFFTGLLVAFALIIFLLQGRLFRVGALEEFQAGGGVSLLHSSLGGFPALLFASLVPLGVTLLAWSRRKRYDGLR